MSRLIEAINNAYDPTERLWLTRDERAITKKLKDYLRNDGDAHKYKYFADLLDHFTIVFVNYDYNPDFTASADFQNKVIRISTGFIIKDPLKEKEMYDQLSVLIRHEMAHILMKHQQRMSNKIIGQYGDEAEKRILSSGAMHDLENIIMDFEISNRRYSEKDCAVVRNMKLNGVLIGGLIAKDFKADWETLTLEEMYDKLSEVLADEHARLSFYISDGDTDSIDDDLPEDDPDMDDAKLLNLIKHSDKYQGHGMLYNYVRALNSTTQIPDISEFKADAEAGKLNDSAAAIGKELVPHLIINKNNTCDFSADEMKKLLKDIALTSPMKPFYVQNPKAGDIITTLYTPEEKFIAMEVIKSALDDLTAFERWEEEIVKKLGGKYTTAELQDILDSLQ